MPYYYSLTMTKGIIQLCYRKIIDASSEKIWDKYVFESSYKEFLMQSQLYNQEKKYKSFAELLLNMPGTEKLHFLVSAALTGYIQQLNGKIPDILNNLGRHFLEFINFRFEIINSDVMDKSKHQVAINFFSEPMLWHDTVDNHLLLSALNAEKNEDGILTHLMQLQPFLSIYSIKSETA
jgi:hypothetical protein